MRKTGRPSIVFWFYCGIYIFIFLATLSHLFTKELDLEVILEPIVTGIVSLLLIRFAYKSKSMYLDSVETAELIAQEEKRNDDILKHAEAIILAEKIKGKSE